MCESIASRQHGEELIRRTTVIVEYPCEVFVPTEAYTAWQKMAGRSRALDGAHGRAQGVSRWRPFARRRFST